MNDSKLLYSRARKASSELRYLSVKERLEFVERLKHTILKNMEDIILSIVGLTSKNSFEVLSTEIFPVIAYLDYLVKNASKILKPKTVRTPFFMLGKMSRIYYTPRGVSLIISPWNFPFYLSIIPTINSFVAGNATILKPSEHSMLVGLIENLLNESHFLANWVQVAYGDGSLAEELIEQKPDIVLFTGSVSTGKKIAEKTASLLIPTILELGGKDPCIICDDTDLRKAAKAVVWGSFSNCGQVCVSVENVFVQDRVYDRFKKYLTAELKKLQVNDSIYLDHHRKFLESIADSIEKDTNLSVTGNYKNLEPSIIEGVDEESKLFTEEVFGPFCNIVRFKKDTDLIEKLNSSKFGLSASIWCSSKRRINRFIHLLDVGSISVNNVMVTLAHPALPFGGVKSSGIGRYKGEEGLRQFSNIKSVVVDKLINVPEAHWFPYEKEKYEVLYNFIKGFFSKKIIDRIKSIFYGIKFFLYRDK